MDTEGKLTFLSYAYASAGYSYVYAWDRTAGAELYPQPRHTLKFKLGMDTARAADKEGEVKKITLHVWAGGRWFSAIETIQSSGGSRFILDVYTAVGIGKHFKVSASADNLTGTIDQFFGPAVPQTFSVGLNYTY